MRLRQIRLSLIRTDKARSKPVGKVNISNYVDEWYNEQRLKGITEITLYGYRRKVQAILDVYSRPQELDIKEFLTKKQETGCYSGTIANYVKAFRSFFGYLFGKGLYNLDPRCLSLPKIHHREKRIPRDEDIARLLNMPARAEDTIALFLLIDCGIRIHELVTIKLKNINLDDASILINGKGDKMRTVYLSEKTVCYLREYVKMCRGEYLFPSTRADAVIPHRGNRYFQEHLTELCDKAGIERITPHQLRH